MNQKEVEFYKENRFFYNPQLLQLEVTNRCPLKCSQCYKPPNGGVDIDIDLVKEILDDAGKCGIKYLMLNGGEPLIYPHFIELLYYAKENKMQVACVTSGYSLTEDYIEKIKKIGCYLQLNISLNGSTKEIHNKSRDGYEYAMKAIEILNKSHFPFDFNWVSRTDNIYDLPALIKFAKKVHAGGITITTTKLTSKGVLQSSLSTEEYLFLKKVCDEHKQFVTIQHCFPFLNRIVKVFNKNRCNQCPSGINVMCIDAEGDFRPCVHLYNKEKRKLYNNSIQEYWLHSAIINQIRTAQNTTYENCYDCVDKKYCRTCFCTNADNQENLTIGDASCPIKTLINGGIL